MAYTVKEVSNLSGISVRTLHYYDEIGLLKPHHIGNNGYRYYEHEQLLRLQQIMVYRELDLPLSEIGKVLEQTKEQKLRFYRSIEPRSRPKSSACILSYRPSTKRWLI